MSTDPAQATGGLRYDTGKNRIELVPPEWIWMLADVTTQGSKKYAERNWEKGMKWSKLVGCMFRHAIKWIAGETHDKETGCHHLAMVAWNALALATYQLRGVGENDVPDPVAFTMPINVLHETGYPDGASRGQPRDRGALQRGTFNARQGV